MKKLVFTFLVAIAATNLWAQQPLCPTKEGVSLMYVTKNAKGNVSGYLQQAVTSVEGSGNNFTITFACEAMDAKKKAISNAPFISYTYKVQNGAVTIDPKALLNSISTSLPIDGVAEGTPIILPANMKAGDVLPDSEMKMQISFVKLSGSYTDGICEGEESITTEAGTFLCKKTKYNCKSSAMGIKTDVVIHTWYAPGIGIVKQDIYNNKGKLNSSQELIKINS